jgi:hypothetical protein
VKPANCRTSRACSTGGAVATELLADKLLLHYKQDCFGPYQGEPDIAFSGTFSVAMQMQNLDTARLPALGGVKFKNDCAP